MSAKGDDSFPMQPPRALWEIRDAMGREDLLISDVGLHKLWIARMFPAHEPNTVFIANGLAGMGIALPTAIAAKLVHPERKVITVNGDGGFLMNCQELETAVRLRTPIVNVIWENSQYGSIVWKQDKKFGRHFGIDFTNPDFVKLADAFGMPAWRCEKTEDFGRHLRHALTLDLPVADRAADRLLDRRGDLGRTRNGDRCRMSITADQEKTRPHQRQHAAVHRRRVARGDRAAPRSTSRTRRRARRSPRSPTPRPRTPRPRSTPPAPSQAEWAAHPPRERGEILRRAYEALTAKADELALVMTLEMGKPLAESKAEIAYASEFFRWFAEEAVRIEGRYATAPNGAGRLLTMRQPVGPCYMITPWNFPMAMGTRKIGPAIAAGCTMVVKPAQQTPLSMLALGEILEEAGLPAGVLNIVTSSKSSDVSKPIIGDARLRKLSLHRLDRGRPQADRAVGAQHPARVDGAGRERAVPRLRRRRRRRRGRGRGDRQDAQHRRGVHGGQPLPRRREGAGRVHREARGQARRDAGRARHRGRRQGRPADRRDAAREGQGARRRRRRRKGAQVVLGGTERDGAGYFFEPTVLAGVPVEARLLKEEIFGPVAPVATFDDEEAAVAAANDTEYGLVAYVYTQRHQARVPRRARALETGMVGLNQGLVSNPAAPFGGVKQSGFGREGGAEGIHEYLEVKYVAMNL